MKARHHKGVPMTHFASSFKSLFLLSIVLAGLATTVTACDVHTRPEELRTLSVDPDKTLNEQSEKAE